MPEVVPEVVSVEKRSAMALLKDGNQVRIPWSGIEWAREYVSVNRIGNKLQKVSDVIIAGDVVWLSKDAATGWSLAQIPEVQGALVSVNPKVKLRRVRFDFTGIPLNSNNSCSLGRSDFKRS